MEPVPFHQAFDTSFRTPSGLSTSHLARKGRRSSSEMPRGAAAMEQTYCTSLRTTHQPRQSVLGSNRLGAECELQAAFNTAGAGEHGQQDCHVSGVCNYEKGPGQNQPPTTCQSPNSYLFCFSFLPKPLNVEKEILDVGVMEGSFGGSFQKKATGML